MAQHKTFITCHVLDTTTGRPAANVSVTLSLALPDLPTALQHTLSARTDSDGRIKSWTSTGTTEEQTPEMLMAAGVEAGLLPEQGVPWRLTFDTGAYFGGAGKTFFPQVEVPFYTDRGETHFHVPLLLGPWGYTTYRGS